MIFNTIWRFRYQTILLLLVIVGGWWWLLPYDEPDSPLPPKAVAGRLDLTDWAYKQPLFLNGTWEFYWQKLLTPQEFESPNRPLPQLVEVPASWDQYDATYGANGFGTYRLQVQLDDSQRLVALLIPQLDTSYKMWLDGKLLASNGVVGETRIQTQPQYLPHVRFFQPEKDNFEVVIQVANFHNRRGGLTHALQFGLIDQIQHEREKQLIFEFILFGSVSMIGLYHLGLYSRRRSNPSTLYLGGVCLIVAIRVLILGSLYLVVLLPNISWVLVHKLDYITVHLGLPLFALFWAQLYRDEINRWFVRGLVGVSSLFLLVDFLTPPEIYSQGGVAYQIILIISCLYILAALALAFYRGRKGAGLMLFAFLVLFLTALNDILYTHSITQIGNLMTFGFQFFIFAQSYILSTRFARAFSEVEQLSEELISANQAKEQAYIELQKHRDHLEELVSQRTAELRDAKKAAEAANQAKSDFLSSMSHELRTPLNGILGYTQILTRNNSLSPSQKNQIGIIHQSGHHLLMLINEILDLSKIEARKMELDPKVLHLESFLRGIIGIISMRAQQKDVLFTYQSDEKLPTAIKADEKRLRQVLLNLLGNAVKFTHYGQVTLKVSLQGNTQHVTLRFEIIDTGVGMTPQQLEKIFLPFEQVGEPGQRAQGTGLGLAITQQLVNLMGGHVHVESELGKGSRFWFDLSFPVVEVAVIEEQIEQNRKITGYKGKRLKVLVVDDKAENRYVLRDLLTPLGFEIEEACDGQQAVEVTQRQKPDLLLTDLVMPVMDGFEAVKAIRQFDSKSPIIAISASVWEAEEQLSLKIGCNAFLSKPVDAQKLLTVIEKHMQIDWLYEESSTKPKQTDEQVLIPPPPEQLKGLYEAAMLGMMSQIRKQMDELEQLDAKYAPFASQIRQLARRFEDEKIVTLVEGYLR